MSEIRNAVEPAGALAIIESNWKKWAEMFNDPKWVVGVSGGVDSTVVLALATRIFGKDKVYGVKLPNRVQSDESYADAAIRFAGCHSDRIDVGKSVEGIINGILVGTGKTASVQARINLPPRIRLAALYAYAQTIDGIVLNTSNLSEDMLGYATLWGDTCGSYAPIQGLTKSEVVSLAEYLGVPRDLAHKPPADGLQGSTDEERLGVTYESVDRYIRDGVAKNDSFLKRVVDLYRANRFKIDMVNLPGPKFESWPNHIKNDTKGK